MSAISIDFEKFYAKMNILFFFYQLFTRYYCERKKKMKGFGYFCTLVCLVTALVTVMPTEKEGEIYSDTVRLHILASSDSDEDQRIKLQIRDFILDEGFLSTGTPKDRLDAEEILRAGIPDTEAAINDELRKIGVDYTASITLGEEWYDTREYENFTLPKGYYTSYRVVLGDGDGENWWCVMYPPICKGLATDNLRDDAASYSDEEYRLISSGKYNIKFKILEAISARFKK